ncbi:maltokinase N-terminal cap-like domain-containing protein [Glutamicibacter sp. BSL13]
MGIIYATTMDPTKTELLTSWLPQQDFFSGTARPQLDTVGGFRLEDPAGQVGMEFIIDLDRQDGTVYHLPLSYRGEPLEGGQDHLLGTSQHGVLGLRYVYDAEHDPTWQQCVRDLFAGLSVPQHQNNSDTDEPRVTVEGGVHTTGSDAIGIERRPRPGAGTGHYLSAEWVDGDGATQRGAVLRMA